MAQERLQKVMARAGIASRRKCEDLILEGVVRVNGQTVNELPAFVDPDVDTITVEGRKIKPERKVYYMLNKPKGVLCTSSDPRGRRSAVDLVPVKQRVYCIGRLDKDTTGLIILTNDSELTNRLTHPKFKIPKTYQVKIEGSITPEAIEKLKKGMWLSEGKTAKSAVKIIRKTPSQSDIEITISEGLNRQVRRMLAKVGFKVRALKRVRIGDLLLKGIGVGKYRPLTIAEAKYLRKITGLQD